MWNPDQIYVVEQARRAELYAEAEQERLLSEPEAALPRIARIASALQRLGERLRSSPVTRLHNESRE